MKTSYLLIVFTVLLYGASEAQNSTSNNPINFPASQGNIYISEGILDQKSSVWGSVENLEELKKSKKYLTVSSQLNLSVKQILPSSKKPSLLKVYEFACDCNEEDLYNKLITISGIKGLEYGPKYQPLVLPNDYNLTFSNMYSLDLINAEQAWGITHGDCNVGVAVSDQNYYPNHPELVGKITYYNQANNATRTHGTAVATIVAANTNNGVGFSSIGYNLNVALYRMNYQEMLSASYAGAKVVNLSWATGCYNNSYVQWAIDEVYDNGTFIVAAAGNGGTCGGPGNLVYPAACDNVFAVTSIGPNDNHERTIGNPLTTHQHNSAVDLSAPGYDVPLTPAPGWYLTGNGTSFAAPYVTGTVGLMLCANPCLLNQEIEDILKLSSVNIDGLNPNYAGLIGAGRLDAGAAVAMAYSSSSNTDPCGGNKVLICHKGNTLSVNVNALPAHLAHGDDLGACGLMPHPELLMRTNAEYNLPERDGLQSTVANHMDLYPNPTKGVFSVKLKNKQEGMLHIYDLHGQMVRSEQITSSNALVVDLSSEQNGIYIMKLITQEKVITQRLVKQ